MTVVELIKRLEEVLETSGDPSLEVVFDDGIGTFCVGKVETCMADEETPLDKPNEKVVVLSRR